MPIREYRCQCGEISEYITQKMEEEKPCKRCKASAKLIISRPSPPKFKGQGFYETDYKNADKNNSN